MPFDEGHNWTAQALNLENLTAEQITEQRNQYEQPWNRFHTIRTVFAVLSFILLLLPSFYPKA